MEIIKIELAKLLTKEIGEIFSSESSRAMQLGKKLDDSFVTEIDYLVSNYLKKSFSEHNQYKNFHFYSEEDIGLFHYPCIVLDPIDGTRELVKGRAECAVSLAIMHSEDINDPRNYAWLYNPFSGFSLDTNHHCIISINHSTQKLTGMVSRSEYDLGLFSNIKNKTIQVVPRGSIAFKLGLLASGACDFVISKRPKNVWDIAAGTILAKKRGYNFYVNGVEKKILDLEKYEGILVWAREMHLADIMTEFHL